MSDIFKKITKNILIFPLLLVMLTLVIGVSYAYYEISFVGKKEVSLNVLGGINLTLNLNTPSYTLDDDKMSNEKGKVQDTYYEFSVSATATKPKSINYLIYLEEDNANTIDNSNVYIYLTDDNDNMLKSPVLVSNLSTYQEANTKSLFVNGFSFVREGTKIHNYRLRSWLSEDSTSTGEYKYRVRVVVSEDEKTSLEQEGVYITSARYLNDTNVNENLCEIENAYSSKFDTNIMLSSSDDSSITYEVTIYNGNDYVYYLKDIVKSEYTNEDITYTIDGLNINDQLSSKESRTFTITYHYKDGAKTNTLSADLDFAFEKAIYVDITFDGNGGSVDASPKEVIYNSTYGELPTPIRDGYTFSGWSVEQVGKELITENTIVNIDTDHTLYAQWNAKSYTIRYHANGGEGTMVDQVIKYDAIVSLSKNIFTKEGYKFYGWALTSDGEKAYNDMDSVVNLKLDGVVELYALWVEDSYTVTFDYNGGSGTVDTTQVLYGKEYGTLPDYPYRENMVFIGWYTAKSGGVQIFSNSIVNIKGDHTLYAQWESSPSNTAIQDLVVKNVPDQNNDGVIDAAYLSFKCSSSFEKYNIPIKNLVVGQKYKLSFVVSNNAQFGTIESGYKNSIFGSMITKEAILSSGSIKEEVVADGGLVAQWSDRTKGDTWLNGPFSKEMVFIAEASTMYWTWDFGLMKDGYLYEYNITNIILVPVLPEIDFANKNLIVHNTSTAQVLNDVSTEYKTDFTFYGAGYAETLYYPITDLIAGSTYTITFEHLYTGELIDDSANTTNLRYEYGTGIMNSAPTSFGSYMSSLGTYASNTYVMKTVTGNKETITLTFTSSSTTAYWVWNMANCRDSYNNLISIEVTKFSASHKNGGQITYYSK